MPFRNSLVFILCFISLSTLQAQKSRFSGYTVNTKGDTTRGYLKYRSYTKSALGCNFSEDGTNYQILGPNDILAYGMDDANAFRAKELSNGDTIFLEVFYQGEYALYMTKTTGTRTSYYVEGPDKKLVLLRVKKLSRGGKTQIINEYQDVLFSLLMVDTSMSEKIRTARLNKKSLAKLFAYYDKQQGNSSKTIGGSLKKPVILSALMGLNQSSLNFETQPGEVTNTGFALGLSVSKELSNGSGRLWIESNLQISRRKFVQDFSTPFVFGEDINGLVEVHRLPLNPVETLAPPEYSINLDYESTFINLPISIKYYLPLGKFNLFVEGGYQLIADLSQKLRAEESIIRSGIVVFYDEVHDDFIPAFQSAYLAGLGVSTSGRLPMEIGFRYTSQVEMAGGNGGVIGVDTWQVLLKVPLTKN